MIGGFVPPLAMSSTPRLFLPVAALIVTQIIGWGASFNLPGVTGAAMAAEGGGCLRKDFRLEVVAGSRVRREDRHRADAAELATRWEQAVADLPPWSEGPANP